MKKQVTIKDIARQLNIHHTTVSRALRNRPDISEETRRNVLAVAKELNYQPNPFAASLRSNKSSVIGVIVPELYHSFFSSFVSEVTNAADRLGYSVMICQSYENVEREKKNILALLKNRVAGVIATVSQYTQSGEDFKVFLEAKIPLVFFDRFCSDLETDRVIVDFYGGTCELVEFLLATGYQRIAHIAGPQHIQGARERLLGYIDVLRRHNLKVDDDFMIRGGFLVEDGVKGAEQLLQNNRAPDAIFAVNDDVAIGAMFTLISKGLHVPKDIAVVGFDNDRLSAFTNPPLTSVDIQRDLLGRKAVELLIRRIESRKAELPFKSSRIKTNLVRRNSA